MRLYEPPAKEFFRLPNSIFHVPLDATQFKLYAYLVCCSGSKGYCWPTHKKIIQDTGIKKSSLQKAIKVLVKRKLITMYKHRNPYGYSNNEYHLLSLDNPEIYRDLDTEADELPLFIGEELPA
jgi:DNA-binding MarR family transcriptional regulator